MTKISNKLGIIVMVITMVIYTFALTSCDLSGSLADYKAIAEVTIQCHADAKIAENEYTNAGLEAIAKVVVDGKDAVNNAITKIAVDAAVSKAKTEINDVPKKKENSIEFERVVVEATFGGTNNQLPTSTIVQSQETLLTLLSENGIQWEDDIAIWSSYDSEYFENMALVFHFFGVSGSHAPKYSVEDVQVLDTELMLLLAQQGSTDGRIYFYIIVVIEVSKSDIVHVVSIDADIRIVEDINMI